MTKLIKYWGTHTSVDFVTLVQFKRTWELLLLLAIFHLSSFFSGDLFLCPTKCVLSSFIHLFVDIFLLWVAGVWKRGQCFIYIYIYIYMCAYVCLFFCCSISNDHCSTMNDVVVLHSAPNCKRTVCERFEMEHKHRQNILFYLSAHAQSGVAPELTTATVWETVRNSLYAMYQD